MRRLVLSLACALSACAGRLEDPSAFEAPEVCDLDVPQDILIPRCASNTGCHVPSTPQGGLELLTGGVEGRLVAVESTTCVGELRIDPERYEESHILVRLSPNPHCRGEPIDRMPYGGAPLDERELACVRAWVAELVGR